MPDQTTVYTLTPNAGSPVSFNNGDFGRGSTDDIYYLTDVQGIDSPAHRVVRFKKPIAHGSRLGPTLEEGLQPRFEGMIVVQSVFSGDNIRSKRMQMYDTLKTCLRACLSTAGTLTWTESGVGAKSLAVQYEVPIAHTWSDEYQAMLFTFGLASEASQPS